MNQIVSIIVPVYNSEKFLKSCLESIQNQSYSNFECILIDDGSTDKSSDICKQFCKSDARFSFFQKRNGGVSSARNMGLKYTRGGVYMLCGFR